MVAPNDLSRFLPQTEYLANRVDTLARMLKGGIPPEYVRIELGDVLREIGAFTRSRINLAALDERIRSWSSVDTDALAKAHALLDKAPKDEAAPNANKV